MAGQLKLPTDAQLDAIIRQASIKGSCVYVIGSALGFKIGHTVNLENRLKELQTGSPVTLHFEIVIPTGEASRLEFCLHRRFASNRTRGEWFNLTPDDLKFLRSLDASEIRHVLDNDIPF